MKLSRTLIIALLAVLVLFSTACKKKVAAAAPAKTPAAASAPAPAPAPTPAPAQEPRQTVAETPRPQYPDAATVQKIEELLARIQDAYFDYDKHLLRKDAQATLMDDAKTLTDILKQYPSYKLTVEGNCDERGSSEYNVALGDARASAAKEYLVSLGIPADQLQTVSFGKEKPVCTEHDEGCWQKNRRAHVNAKSSS